MKVPAPPQSRTGSAHAPTWRRTLHSPPSQSPASPWRFSMEQTAWPRVRTGATLVARLVLGTVFGLAALAKITAPGLFRQDVAAYHLLPPAVVGPFALALPWIEALLALYLLVG